MKITLNLRLFWAAIILFLAFIVSRLVILTKDFTNFIVHPLHPTLFIATLRSLTCILKYF